MSGPVQPQDRAAGWERPLPPPRRAARRLWALGAAIVVAAAASAALLRGPGTQVDVPVERVAPSGAPVEAGSVEAGAPAPITARAAAVVVWTGGELVVWGGVARDGTVLADGARYNPGEGWRPLAPSPLAARSGALGAWTGDAVLVWGGRSDDGLEADGAVYDPRTDAWRRVSAPRPGVRAATQVWTGTELLLVGSPGDQPAGASDRAATAYDPRSGTWRDVAAPPRALGAAPASAWRAVWAGGVAWVWNGRTVGTYDPSTDRWSLGRPTPATATASGAALWTGEEVVVAGAYPRLDRIGYALRWRNDGSYATTSLGPLPVAQPVCSSAWTPDGLVAVQPADDAHAPAAALWEPSLDRWRVIGLGATGVAGPPCGNPAVWDGGGVLLVGSFADSPSVPGDEMEPLELRRWRPGR